MEPKGYVLAFDAQGRVRHWGDGASAVFGWAPDEAVGRKPHEFVVPEQAPATAARMQELLLGHTHQRTGSYLHRDGYEVPVRYRAEPIMQGGRVMGVSVVGELYRVPDYSTPEGLRKGFAEYLVGERGRAATTAYTYENNLLRLERWTGKRREEIGVSDLRRFLRESDYHPTTKSSTLVAQKAFRRWMRVEGLWVPDGTLELEGPRVPKEPKPALMPVEAAVVLDAAKRSRELRVVYLGLFAGMRVTESAHVDVGNWKHDRLRFVGKGSKVREVPLHPMLAQQRDAILYTSPSRDTLKHVVRALAHHTGISFTSHTLRRTFAVTLRDAGVQEGVWMGLLGHSPASVGRAHYAPVSWDEMVDAIGRLNYPELVRESTGEAVQGRLF